MAIIKGEVGMIHNRNEFDSEFRLFKRFLKENGIYKYMMSFLFPGGKDKRTIDDLYMTMLGSSYFKFPNILNYDATLGPEFKKQGLGYWEIHIRKIHYKWYYYWCEKNNIRRYSNVY